eukprot:SAG31_NODE_3462_length_4247_cov_1.909354_3_plen_1108_part_01
MAGDYTLFIELQAREVGWVNITSRSPELPTVLRFLPGTISASTCFPTLLQTITAGEQNTIQIFGRDAFENAVVDSAAASKFGLELLSGPSAWSTGRDDELDETTLTEGSSNYEVSYTINIKGEYQLAINYQIYGIAGSPFLIVVLPAELDPSVSRATGAVLTRAPVGSDNVFHIQCKDRFTNNLDECNAVATVNLRKPSTGFTVTGTSEAQPGGTFAATFTTDETGIYSIRVQLDNVPVFGSPFQCTLDPGPPDPTRSSASGTANQIRASSGLSQVDIGNVVVRLRDQFNNDCSEGYTINVNIVDAEGVGHMITAASPISGSGDWSVEYHTSTNGAYLMSILLGEVHILGSPFNVFVDYGTEFHGLAYGAGLSFAEAGEIAIFYVQFQDEWFNNRTSGEDAHCVVCTLGLASGASGTRPTKTYLGAGLTRVQWSDTAATERSTYFINIYAPNALDTNDGTCGQGALPRPARGGNAGAFNVDIAAGELDPSRCEAVGSAVASATAGVTAFFFIYSKDRFNNPVPASGLDFVAEFTGPEAHEIVAQQFSDISFRVSYEIQTRGQYDLSIKVNSQHIRGSPRTLNVRAAATSAPGSTISGLGIRKAEPTVAAEFTVNANDEFGNYVDSLDADERFAVYMTKCETTVGDEEASCSSCDSATLTEISVFSETSSTRTFQYTQNFPSPLPEEWAADYYHTEVMFEKDGVATHVTGSPACVQVSEAAAFNSYGWGAGMSGGVAGTTMEFFVQGVFTDLAQNITTNSEAYTVQAQPVIGSCEGCTTVSGTSVYLAEGKYLLDFSESPIRTAGTYSLSVFSANGVIKELAIADNADGDRVFAKQGEADPVVWEECWNPDLCTEEAIADQILGCGYPMQCLSERDNPFAILVVPAVTSPSTSSVTGTGAQACVAGVPAVFNILARDEYGNMQQYETAEDTATMAITGATSVVEDPRYLGNGVYELRYTVQTFNVTRPNRLLDLAVTVNDIGVGSTSGAFVVTSIAGAVAPASCTVTSPTESTAGLASSVEITSIDLHGNERESGDVNFTAILAGTGGLAVNMEDSQGEVVDQSNGKYVVTYESNIAGAYSLTISSDGVEVLGSPFALTVVADVASASG